MLHVSGQALAYIYARDIKAQADIAKVLTFDEARRIAVNVVKLPESSASATYAQLRLHVTLGFHMTIRTLTALGLFLTTPALSEESPAFDCTKAKSSAEKLICEDADLAKLDRLIADRYAAALEAIKGLDTGSARAEKTLRANQRGWIKGRDDCWKAADLRECVEAAYLRREGQLVARWMLEEPKGVFFWGCGGNPANEVVTVFFDTTLPSVRFERGDTIDTGSLVRTASGSRYEGSFGRSIWIKGDRAAYREADPDGTTYECTLSKKR